MTGRGQHDADRGEHRGPQDPNIASGAHDPEDASGAHRPEVASAARRARVGGSHGALIIALALPAPYGRSARCRTTHKITIWGKVPAHTPMAVARASAVWGVSRQVGDCARMLAAIRNGMSSRGREAGA